MSEGGLCIAIGAVAKGRAGKCLETGPGLGLLRTMEFPGRYHETESRASRGRMEGKTMEFFAGTSGPR